MSPTPPAGDAGGEIVTVRVLPAPREHVFAAHADPAALAAWWGPKGFTNVFHAFEFRPGGAWRFTMRGPGDAAYEMNHEFAEIVAPERIVVRHLQRGHDFTLTITLTAQPGGTEVAWRMVFDDPAEGARLRDFIAAANAENLDRLAAHLRAQP
jgi:uncharacterized protein YndB with AHSA1/START domain